MLRLPRAKIVTQDKVFATVEQGEGLVIASGESPNCIVKISVADHISKKYRQLDRLTNANYVRKGDVWTFTGTSQHLIDSVGARGDEAILSFTVTPGPGCEDCA